MTDPVLVKDFGSRGYQVMWNCGPLSDVAVGSELAETLENCGVPPARLSLRRLRRARFRVQLSGVSEAVRLEAVFRFKGVGSGVYHGILSADGRRLDVDLGEADVKAALRRHDFFREPVFRATVGQRLIDDSFPASPKMVARSPDEAKPRRERPASGNHALHKDLTPRGAKFLKKFRRGSVGLDTLSLKQALHLQRRADSYPLPKLCNKIADLLKRRASSKKKVSGSVIRT